MTAKARGRKSIFITGAASGIGRATAAFFVEKGWFVGAYDINEAGLASLAEEIGADNCTTGLLDVTDKRQFEAAVAAFGAETGGTMDILFNNAGIGEGGWFEDVPYETSLNIIKVNLVGVITGIYAALPMLKATRNSLCFSTSSSSAMYGIPRLAVYAATKFAVKGLTEALSVEFARHGIRVADTLPGLIDTPILHNRAYVEPGKRGAEKDTLRAQAPQRGPLSIRPARAVAQALWAAYGSDALHWYVPASLAWIDRIKGFAPKFVRARVRAAGRRSPHNL